jgi:hypothetical protein
MTHKYKKPGANVSVRSPFEGIGRQQNEQAVVDQVINRARSAVDAIQENISDHYGIWAGIGLVSAAAIYLFATQHGRNVSRQIQDTLSDRFSKLKDATMDVVNKTISEQDVTEEDRDMPRLRRAG